MRRFPKLALLAAFASAITLAPVPAWSLSAPETLAAGADLGGLAGAAPVIDPSFAVDFVGLSWSTGEEPEVRFLATDGWTPWRTAHLDGLPSVGGRVGSGLLTGGGADAYQVRGEAEDVRAVAINTTDGPRSREWSRPDTASATDLSQPPVISRQEWGADESFRFDSNGRLRSTPTFFPTQKLIVHHTVTGNADPDPAATVRAIYYDHVKNRGFADIAYNFLIDAQGNIYKGRYSGKPGTSDADTPTGENAGGKGVTGAHTGGYNSGTVGVALLGTFTSVAPTPQARDALIEHLAWESERHGLDPLAKSVYTNPDSGESKKAPNITGHRDWGSTACPGGALYADLPAIRQEAAGRAGRTDARPPRIKEIDGDAGRRSAVIRWETNEPADSQVRYRAKGGGWRTSALKPRAVEEHKLKLRGLKGGRTYSYRVLSRDRSGNVGRSRRLRFETAA